MFFFSDFPQKLSLHLKFYQFTPIKGVPFGWLQAQLQPVSQSQTGVGLFRQNVRSNLGTTKHQCSILWHQCKYRQSITNNQQFRNVSKSIKKSTVSIVYNRFQFLLYLLKTVEILSWISRGCYKNMPLSEPSCESKLRHPSRWMKQVSGRTCHLNHNG